MHSIRLRLAAWYFVSVAALLALFGIGAWLALRASVSAAVDHDLQQRIRDVAGFISQELGEGEAALLEELQEHSQLGLGGGLLQLSYARGRLLFRSGRLKSLSLNLPAPAPGDTNVRFASLRSGVMNVRSAAQTVEVSGRQFLIQVAEPMQQFDESAGRFKLVLLLLAPIFLGLASAGGFWMSSRALAPVDRITNEARAISAANLASRLHVPPVQDELARLAQTLNQMLDRIEAEMKRIVQFTADASHELRAPLTLIQTAAEFSLRRERSPEELVDALRKILHEAEHTSQLVDQLLLLARADSHADTPELSPTDVSSTGRQAMELVSTFARAKNIEFSSEIPSEAILTNGDTRLLEQLWLILLDNAVKYTPAGGKVRFAMRPASSRMEVSVTDTGIGISSQELPYVYDRFWRADRVRSRNTNGAGLGLSIARWIVQKHCGEIRIDSTPGRGSQVRVWLPLANR